VKEGERWDRNYVCVYEIKSVMKGLWEKDGGIWLWKILKEET